MTAPSSLVIEHSECNQKQLIAMLKQAEEEKDAQMVEEGMMTSATRGMTVRHMTEMRPVKRKIQRQSQS